jgi:hypothetical protein
VIDSYTITVDVARWHGGRARVRPERASSRSVSARCRCRGLSCKRPIARTCHHRRRRHRQPSMVMGQPA